MNRSSTISTRYLSAILITVLLLVQSALVFHEVEHAVSGENDHCISCELANQQHSSAANNFQINLPVYLDVFIVSALVNLSIFYTFDSYTTRAPPTSFFK